MAKPAFEGSRKKLPLNVLVVDPACQARAGGLNLAHAQDLADDMKAGDKLPDPWVLDVEGHGMLIVGGFHTVKGHEINGDTEIYAIVRSGSYGEALIEAAGSNNDAMHKALKMTRDDKQRAVRMALKGNELLTVREQWGDRAIAKHIGVSHTMVSDMRKEIEARANGKPSPKKAAAAKAAAKVAGVVAPAAEKPAKPAEKVTSIQSDEWQGWPLDEVLKDQPDYVAASIKGSGIKTVGRLLEELDEGVTLGLMKAPLKKLHEQLETIRDGTDKAAPPPRDLPQRFDWSAREKQIAAGCRAMESIRNEFQIDSKGEEYKAVDAAFALIQKTFVAWKKQYGSKK